jgi:cytoskeletal protein CcmA (bactofilin family)
MWHNVPGNPPSPPGTGKGGALPYDNFRQDSGLSHEETNLGPGLTLKGDLTGQEDIYLDCSLDGPVNFEGNRVTIGRNANVAGNVMAREAVLHGKLTGDLHARDRVEIKKGGSFAGDLLTGRISVEEGAYFKGHIEVDPKNKAVGADFGKVLETVHSK